MHDLDWPECSTSYADSPSTKAERCLREVFNLTPIRELCRYSVEVGDEARHIARKYFERTCKVSAGTNGRYPVALIHYEGNTSRRLKDIPTNIVGHVCAQILELGHVPVILDWDRRTTLAEGAEIHNPDANCELWKGMGTGDAEVIAALTELATLMIGIDSGPLHVAGATTTPTLGVWTRHHPLHYFGLAYNVTHLVPRDHAELIRGNAGIGEAYFNANYRCHFYDDLDETLQAVVRARLETPTGSLVYTRKFWVRTENVEQDLVVVQDIAEEDSYRIDEMPMPRPVVVDVGAHIGCFSKRIHDRNPLARIFAVECCPENIAALKQNVADFATVVQAAVTYQPNVALLNAVYPACVSTGGSTVIDRDELERQVAELKCAELPGDDMPSQHWADLRPLATLTLEDLIREHGFDRIDVLKLDCEGSEFSILGETPSLDRIGLIVGEYHGKERFLELVKTRLDGWQLRIIRDGELGTFWLSNPGFRGVCGIAGELSLERFANTNGDEAHGNIPPLQANLTTAGAEAARS